MVHPDFAVIPASAQVETSSTVGEILLRQGFELQFIHFREMPQLSPGYRDANEAAHSAAASVGHEMGLKTSNHNDDYCDGVFVTTG